MAETLYDVLGVAADAPAEDVRAAYRERARRLHPCPGGTDVRAMRGGAAGRKACVSPVAGR